MAHTCPVCAGKMKPVTVSGIIIDACHGGCGGLWFDQHELQKFDEVHEDEEGALLGIPFNPGVRVDHRRRRLCPRCPESIPLHRHFYSPRQRVEVDSCPACGGYWLDCGELNRIRREAQSSSPSKPAKLPKFSAALKELGPTRAEKRQQESVIRKLMFFIGFR